MASLRSSTSEEKSWILYDAGNSAFVLIIVTAIGPIFFKDFAAINLENAASTANWGFANSSASLILAILSPILGTLADFKGKKKNFFRFFLGIGLIFTLALTLVQPGQWMLCLTLFVLARVGWAGANIFYDAFLPDITTRGRMDLVSARGYAYGYIGSVIPFLFIIGLLLSASGNGILPPVQTKIGFVLVAAWWLALSVPALKNLRQKYYNPLSGPLFKASFKQLADTFKNARRHRQVFLFLAAYFFYIDGVGTIISMSTAYGRDLGFSTNLLIIVLLFIQVTAFPFALLYGKLAERFGTRNMLLSGIGIYTLVTLLAFMLPDIENITTKTMTFWFIAFLVASSMGGVQGLSRSFYAALIPPEQSAEFFGFYNVFGKFAAICGPFIMGVTGHLTGDTRWGVLSIITFFIAGGLLLMRVQPDADRPDQ